jgi:peroxiredoxin
MQQWNRIGWLLLVLGFRTGLKGQDVAFYLDQMNTDAAIDPSFNARIDTIWSHTQRGIIDSTDYTEAVRELQRYYDRAASEITGDKAELFAYFLLLRFQDYPAIIDRFEGRMGDYNHRAFTTIGEIYRRASFNYLGGGITAYQSRLDSLSATVRSPDFTDFLRSALDIQVGQEAPPFELRDLNGRVYHSDSLRGKVIVLDFWSTSCAPCINEIPEIRAMHEKYGGRSDFTLISISCDRDVSRWNDFIHQRDLNWPQVIDRPEDGGLPTRIGVMTAKYKAQGIPKYILIDREGIIRYNSHLSNNRFIPDAVVNRQLRTGN